MIEIDNECDYANYVASKYQLGCMNATIYKMADGAEVLQSCNYIVAMRLPDGTFAFSRYWINIDASYITKYHITTWSGKSLATLRKGLKCYWFAPLLEIDVAYLRAIEMATGGRIGPRSYKA